MASVAKQAKHRSSNKADEALAHLTSVADRMHALLVERADVLIGCLEGSPEEGELTSIVAAVESYEAKRWPLGKVPGGKG